MSCGVAESQNGTEPRHTLSGSKVEASLLTIGWIRQSGETQIVNHSFSNNRVRAGLDRLERVIRKWKLAENRCENSAKRRPTYIRLERP